MSRAMRLVAQMWLAAGLAACGGGGGATGESLPKAKYSVQVLTTVGEIGEVRAFNVNGVLVSKSAVHGWAIIDTTTRVFTELTDAELVIGLDDAGDVLYRPFIGDHGLVYNLRSAAGTTTELPFTLDGRGYFRPFALATDGAVWGYTRQQIPGGDTTPGYGRLAGGDIAQFRDWAGHDEEQGALPQQPFGIDHMGRAVFCESPPFTGGGNGLPKTFCRLVGADNSLTEIGTDVDDEYSVRVVPITPGGRLGGTVNLGANNFGLSGSYPALFDGATTEMLGDEQGEVLGLTDRGDVIFTQLGLSDVIRIRNAAGEVAVLDDYVIDPDHPHQLVSGSRVLAIANDGRILIEHAVAGATEFNVELLTPQ